MDDYVSYIGTRQVWGGNEPLAFHGVDRRNHTYIIGKTGTGKTTLIRNMIVQDLEAGRGVGLIDPHGDMATELLDVVPPARTDDVVYFNPADQEYPVGMNLLAGGTRETRHLIASGIVSSLKSIWRDSWGPRLENLLYASVAALHECENVTLLGVQRMLIDTPYRQWVLRQVTDSLVRAFWEKEFAGYDKRFLSEIISPVLNKVGQLFMAAPMRNVLGQVKRKFDPRFMMDHRRIFIANLSKGRLGEDKSNLLGALIVTQFQLAAMARADIPERDRVDFNLYVDEFHNFATDSFAGILSEARKYRLCLSLSHQFTAQLRPEVREAVFGNVGTFIAFRVGDADGQLLAREFGNGFTADQFADLANHQVLVKLLSNGSHGEPFQGTTYPPIASRSGSRTNLIKRSRERYALRRKVVEDKIERWLK